MGQTGGSGLTHICLFTLSFWWKIRRTLFSSGVVEAGSAAGSAASREEAGLFSVWSSDVCVSVCVSGVGSGFSSVATTSASFSTSGSGSGLAVTASSSSTVTAGSELEAHDKLGNDRWRLYL